MALQIDGGRRSRGDERHLRLANVAVDRQCLVRSKRPDDHRHVVTLDQLLRLRLRERGIAGGVLRDQLHLAAADRAVALFQKKRGALLLLLAAGGEGSGAHGEKTDAQRLRALP
jgi:hypothetical protein